MKKLIICLFTIAMTLPAICQVDSLPKNTSGNYEYTEVVTIDSVTAEKLYSNAKLFVVTAFQSGKDVTQLNDDATKTVAGVGTVKLNFKGLYAFADEYVKFKFIIQCKDNRYKYTVNNFQLVNLPASPIPLENEKALKRYATHSMREQIYKQVNAKIKALISDLKQAMASQSESTKDW